MSDRTRANRSTVGMLAAAGLLAWSALALVPAAVTPAVAQDDALDKLLEKLDEKPRTPADPAKPAAAPAEANKDEAKAGVKPQDPAKPKAGEVAPGDEDLDSLLKKLGDDPADKPDTTGRARPAGMPPGGEKADRPDALKGDDRSLDKRLEEMVRKKNPEKPEQQDQEDQAGQQGGQGQSKSSDDSPLGQAIKKMEEARQRLSKQDTGAETRKTQGQVVEQLDQILEQMRKAQAQRQQQRQQRLSMRTRQAGQQPGQQQPGPQDQAGNNAQGVGPQAPKKPTVSDVLVGAKDTWGDLPPHLREEMENVFREEMLPAKRDLIIRYYSSVARKGRAQPGGD